MTDDIDILAATAYETGIDPIHYATEHVIRSHITAWLASYADGATDLTAEAVSCRILGDLLGAGWTAPEVTR